MGIHVGDVAEFRKTVGESDVYLFAGITGDMHPNHIDEEYMRAGPYGRRIAHGVLVLGLTSTASTEMARRAGRGAVSYGYDRVRFIAPVFIGDTVSVHYEVERIEAADRRVYSSVVVTRQDGQVALAATHILYFHDGVPE